MRKSNISSKVTASSIIGGRGTQEDRVFARTIEGPDWSGHLLAVIDGHAGTYAAQVCLYEIGRRFHLSSADKTTDALLQLFVDLAEATAESESGAVLSVACILESHENATIAVLGDAPVFVINDEGEFKRSPEHNVRTNLAEREAAVERGAIYIDGYIACGDSRLQMSRALGDSALADYLSREPEIYTVTRPVWLAVCSDGVLARGHVLPLDLLELCKTQPDARSIIEWASGPTHPASDNVSAVVWKR